MIDGSKTTANQVDEIRKLVEDAQDKLDQVARALRTLQDRVTQLGRDEDDSS
jgi:methyl-accepting chemotaxis protein